MNQRPLSDSQLDLVGFLYEWLDLMGTSPTNKEIAEGVGISESNISSKLRSLSFRGLLHLERDNRGFRVVGVVHFDGREISIGGRPRPASSSPYRVFDFDARDGDQVDDKGSCVPLIDRLCLKCRSPFRTDSPYIRLCQECKSSNAELIRMLDVSEQGYLSNLQALMTGGIGGFLRRHAV